jgi:hypothetical protein
MLIPFDHISPEAWSALAWHAGATDQPPSVEAVLAAVTNELLYPNVVALFRDPGQIIDRRKKRPHITSVPGRHPVQAWSKVFVTHRGREAWRWYVRTYEKLLQKAKRPAGAPPRYPKSVQYAVAQRNKRVRLPWKQLYKDAKAKYPDEFGATSSPLQTALELDKWKAAVKYREKHLRKTHLPVNN